VNGANKVDLRPFDPNLAAERERVKAMTLPAMSWHVASSVVALRVQGLEVLRLECFSIYSVLPGVSRAVMTKEV
jgi:hypothetical protein